LLQELLPITKKTMTVSFFTKLSPPCATDTSTRAILLMLVSASKLEV
jgi:hypothetical protein